MDSVREPLDAAAVFAAGALTATAVLAPAAWFFFVKGPGAEWAASKVDVADAAPDASDAPAALEGFADEDLDSDEDEEDEEEDDEEEPLKQVMVVRTDLSMKKGKIAAQCCHASLGAFRRASSPRASETWRTWLRRWLIIGQTKVAVKCQSEAELEEVAQTAQMNQVPFYLVADAGRTQIAAGSRTVCAVGPAPVSVVDAICGQFKLL
ncbi:Peptidyl-tRNA hydrolase 2, mitochondrial [Hondaea fermentalgiana]|uniref:peptidyl-tRNA hydrolase n=1 Tax=Hondaea fermentalgiana TaxID=2315210 RepID=A0A2R5GSG5_9STRA|nr:Peptidyl-tRNA hydrolase 2, mitochondrial [Hondaea fermentalgiana]|eukprot:GBG33535.1 Peptidyl-tRNA hydrolase 2, mitochondrial [Hondaea fermentalgiana]